jgi:TPR repeat protein
MPEYKDQEQDIDLASGLAAFEAKHFSRAIQLLTAYAEGGNAEAQYRLAIMCQNGLGTVRNESLAYSWMSQAASQGYGLAYHGLGFMYLEGDCAERDNRKAAKCFARGTEQGLEGSMIALAQLYDEGRGVRKNPERARELFRRAGCSNP